MTGAAFLLGLTGSLHCMGMCGVLALAAGRSTLRTLLYHIGRTTTYLTMGIVAGWVNNFIALTGWLSWFSVALGVFVILLIFFKAVNGWLITRLSGGLVFFQQQLVTALRGKQVWTSFMVGLLNGWLPCGLVYSAVVLALVQPNFWSSAARYRNGTVTTGSKMGSSQTYKYNTFFFTSTPNMGAGFNGPVAYLAWRIVG